MKNFLALLFLIFASQAYGQNYLVNFTGTGESATVETVKVENLTTGATVNLTGTDILNLTLPTGIIKTGEDRASGLKFFPNPMTDFTGVEVPDEFNGELIISVTDVSGKTILNEKIQHNNPARGFRISGLGNGLYIVNVSEGSYRISGKLVSAGNINGIAKIEEITNPVNPAARAIKENDQKGLAETVNMPYNDGEILKFTGASGDFTTVVTSSFTANKQINFKFVRCKDGDNRNYPVVEIGTQTWMAVNLRSESYRNGELIGTTDPKTLNITSLTNPKFTWIYYGYELELDPAVYGRLYTWHAAVDSRGLCPTGWHLPSQTEWNTLITSLGGSTAAGGKLKETGLAHWNSPNTGATNASGFTAIPNGSRAPAGTCSGYKNFSYLWSSTERDGTYAWYCGMMYNFASADSEINTAKSVGLGVRCIKDL